MEFDLLFCDVTVLTVDEARPVLRHAYLGVTGRKITWLDTNPPQGRARRTLTAPDYVLPRWVWVLKKRAARICRRL